MARVFVRSGARASLIVVLSGGRSYSYGIMIIRREKKCGSTSLL